MPYTIEQIAEEVFILKGAYNSISKDVKELNSTVKDLYFKTERDKSEIIERIERNRTELIDRIVQNKTELIERIERNKTELIKWMIGLLIGFGALIITAMWAILSFAV